MGLHSWVIDHMISMVSIISMIDIDHHMISMIMQ